MASLVKEFSQEKLFGQVYTPNFVVCKILDDIGFCSSEILGKPVLDPACGDGRFLTEVAERIIKFSPKEDLKANLEKVYGWDIDQDAVRLCIRNLDKITESLNVKIDWNIKVENSIEKLEKPSLFTNRNCHDKFDYIVGNPPYIRIQHLDIIQREYIKINYQFCKSGSTDIYIAFFELCKSLLTDKGICGLITPNTYFYTDTARELRQYFVKNRNIVKITNYGNIQLFDDATTYSAITIFSKKSNKEFLYEKASSENSFENCRISICDLKEPFWQFSAQVSQEDGVRLGDIAKIHVGITTLCDKAYIFGIRDIDEKYVWAETRIAGDVKIERDILKPIIKGSTIKNNQHQINEWILFPYKRIGGKHSIIVESELSNVYPLAYKYLCSIREELDKRDNGKPNTVAWYAFGRSQGLDTSFGKKIIFSPMNNRPNFIYIENEDCTFYSGYCIKYEKDIEWLLKQLNSDRMQKFVEVSSRDYRGGWKAYNKKVIENFVVNK